MFILAAALLTAAPFSSSAQLPIAPEPAIIKAEIPRPKTHNFNKYDYAIYTGVVAYRVADFYTTEAVLHTPHGYEAELPKSFVATKGGFAAFEIGMTGLEIAGSIYLHKHNHAKLARFADALSIAGGGATDISNTRYF